MIKDRAASLFAILRPKESQPIVRQLGFIGTVYTSVLHFNGPDGEFRRGLTIRQRTAEEERIGSERHGLTEAWQDEARVA